MSFDRRIKIAPSILSADFADFGQEIRQRRDKQLKSLVYSG